MKRMLGVAAASLAALSVLAFGGNGGGQADAAPAPAPAQQLSPQQQSLAVSSDAKSVVIDAATGNVLSIKRDSAVQPASLTITNCLAGDSCWAPSRTPLRNYGFRGIGTTNGLWPNRGPMYTRSHAVSVCWVGSPKCSPRFGPNTIIGFNSVVTGLKVTNFT